MTLIETRNDVLLLVGREDFSPPRSFGGAAAVSTRWRTAATLGTDRTQSRASPGLPTPGTLATEDAPRW